MIEELIEFNLFIYMSVKTKCINMLIIDINLKSWK